MQKAQRCLRMKSRMEQCASASPERKLLQWWLQVMLTHRLETPRVVAFIVSLLVMHIHSHRYLYLPLHTNTQGHFSPCSVAGHIFRGMTYWPVRTLVLSVGLAIPASCAFAGQCSCFACSQPQCARHGWLASSEFEWLFARPLQGPLHPIWLSNTLPHSVLSLKDLL